MPKRKNILAVVHDPGGTQALIPVFELLKNPFSYNLDIIAGKFAAPLLEDRSISFKPEAGMIGMDRAEALFERYKPDLLLSGTSWKANLEQMLRNRAVQISIPSVVMLDYWSNYAFRWHESSYSIEGMDDLVCVPDACASEEMKAEGFADNSLSVTGQPYLEKIFSDNDSRFGISTYQNFLFLSQPSVKDGETISTFEHLGLLINVLKTMAEKSAKKISLIFKAHPKEKITKSFKNMLSQLTDSSRLIEISLAEEGLDVCLKSADCVIGYYSMALFEARAQGKKTISLEGYNVSTCVKKAMQEVGIQTVSLNEQSINAAINLGTNSYYPANFHQGAKNRVMEIINSFLQ